MELDLHVHSNYSFDSYSRLSAILKTARERGLDGLAITDHNTIKGSLEALKISDGQLIKSKLSLEVIYEIADQGGLSVPAHPFKRKRNLKSDSHFCFEVGWVRLIAQNTFDAESIRKSILKKQVDVRGIESGCYLDVFSQFIRIVKQKN